LHKFHTAAFPHSSAICACVRDPPDRAPRLLKPLLYPLSYGDREFRKLLHVQARLPHGSQLGPAGRQDVRRPQRSSAVAASSSAPNQVGIVWGLVRGNEVGWGSVQIVGAIVAGLLLLAAFAAWELRAPAPMLPMRFFRNRTFALANAVSLLMSFGMFGAIFLLAQYFQTVQGYSPLQSGLRFLPWTAMPMIVAPIAGARSDKIGGYKLLAVGLVLQAAGLAWIAAIATPTTPYIELVGPFVLAGIGMAHFFAPVANVVLSDVRPEEEGQASGAN